MWKRARYIASMFGVLFDVSGSMEKPFSAHYEKRDALTDDKVKRSHGIITTLNNIVNQEVTTYERNDLVFAITFGLNTSKCESIDTCDFIAMLENRETLQKLHESMPKWKTEYPHEGHRILIEFAKHKNAHHAVPWIKENLSQKEAGILRDILKTDDELTKKFIDLIPPEGTYERAQIGSTAATVATYGGITAWLAGSVLFPFVPPLGFAIAFGSQLVMACGNTALIQIDREVDNHKALKLAHESLEKFNLKNILVNVKPHSVKCVSNLLDTILQENKDTSPTRVHKIIDSIKPYIYGRTPMVKALRKAKEIFDNHKAINPKVLIILSDGKATDGDPTQISALISQDPDIVVATCYFTSDRVSNPKQLVDEEDPSWSKGARILYRISSTMANTKAPITHLIDYGWKLPSSGESRLFVRANSLDVVEEFCKVAVSHLTHSTDALVHMLARVSLATYINQKNEKFKAPCQEGATCYANAIAAVFHLAMHRIEGREGGVPEFDVIRDRIIQEYGTEGAITEDVIKEVCKEYRLRYRKVDVESARQAINERRPVVTTFSFKAKQKEMFEKFYKRSPKAILRPEDVAGSSKIAERHAVVLIRCHPNCLVFMNSWGQEFADGGFFRVKDEKVFDNMEFFDVHWEEDDLTPSEKEAFDRKGVDEWKEILKKYNSIQELTYVCPCCKEKSKVDEFTGHHLEARCPKCLKTFKPDGPGILESLYLHSR